MPDYFFILKLLISGLVVVQIFWAVTDPGKFKDRLKRLTSPRLNITYFLLVFTFLSQALAAYYFPLPTTFLSDFIIVAGFIIYFIGIVLACWAKWTMKENWGTPAQHDIKKQKQLVTKGPYRLSRNPIYLALILMSFGFSLALQSWLIFLVYFLYRYFRGVILKEELLLKKYFGKHYLLYMMNVPRFL